MIYATAAAPEQDNTAPDAAAPATTAASAPTALEPVSQANPANTSQPAPQNTAGNVADPATGETATGEKKDPAAPAMELLLGDDGEGGTDGGTADPAPEGEIDGYELTFPDNMVADDDAVAVLNEVGKEFGVTGEAAQKLADAATAYANRRVDAVLEAGKKGMPNSAPMKRERPRSTTGRITRPSWPKPLSASTNFSPTASPLTPFVTTPTSRRLPMSGGLRTWGGSISN
ncbi:MAG: hypothetical protein LUG50_03480 [Planctomycetaceae bacterium]|nr:hypothetical protein [Planctomycetaceae bacterium]